jgi:hypothetical protein
MNAFAKEKKDRPDMEMLEFLGTYETADCRTIDLLQLKDHPQTAENRGKPVRDRAISRKTEQKMKDGKDE